MPAASIAVVGGGPAGLFAAETAARAGASVTVFDASRSVARKLLVAGYGGLNLTHGEPIGKFISRYRGPDLPSWFGEMIGEFAPDALRQWAADLGIETFEQRTGRVYPRVMKAAPLVRAWLRRLHELGVTIEVRHRLTDIAPGPTLTFHDGPALRFDAAILALGGASWPRTGSDASWISLLQKHGIRITPFQPANCGWEVDWPEDLVSEIEGRPLKNLAATAGGRTVRGELMLTRYGLEGGAIYQLGPELRALAAPVLSVDFKPETSLDVLVRKMESVPRDFLEAASVRWKLPPQTCALLRLLGPSGSALDLARTVKSYPIPLLGPRPIAEAISSAGGVAWTELDENLRLHKLPGIHLAGEMIDWEAPTGGYLIQACFATGRRAAIGAAGSDRRAGPSTPCC
ncbi:NAD(P)/FAD-dependent oxidoreductase [Haloferula sargassicola]|uniref:3-dehydro-bile acid delta(4,6)-reductase n=1 Tax=Haloferula sargassicola TaxID=490096 RepID=A0ABP9UPF3_9BACT